MNKIVKVTAIAAVVGALGVGAVQAGGWGESCDRHERGERGEHGPKHGMMMKRHGMMQRELDLNADKIRTLAEARLIMRGNDRLKVGEVTQKDDDTFVVQIVTVDGSLVKEFEVDKDKGMRRGPRHF